MSLHLSILLWLSAGSALTLVAIGFGWLPVGARERFFGLIALSSVMLALVDTQLPDLWHPLPATVTPTDETRAAPISDHVPAGATQGRSPSLVLGLWLTGAAAWTLLFGWGHVRARRLVGGSLPVRSRLLQASLLRAAKHSRLHGRIRLQESPRLQSAVVHGIMRPLIVLPADADSWSRNRRMAVLLHECAHVRRRDPLRRAAWDVVTAALWFHPLIWMIRRASDLEREILADRHVVNGGRDPLAHADDLLALARQRRSSRGLIAFLTGPLTNRVEALVSPDRVASGFPRGSRGSRVALLLTALAVLSAGRPETGLPARSLAAPDSVSEIARPGLRMHRPHAPPAVSPATAGVHAHTKSDLLTVPLETPSTHVEPSRALVSDARLPARGDDFPEEAVAHSAAPAPRLEPSRDDAARKPRWPRGGLSIVVIIDPTGALQGRSRPSVLADVRIGVGLDEPAPRRGQPTRGG